MEPIAHSKRIHPLVAAAAVSVILVSLVGVAAITGLLPDSRGDAASGANLAASAVEQKADARSDAKVADKASDAPAPPVASPSNTAPKAPVRQAKSSSTHRTAEYRPPVVAKAPVCASCGRVESVQAVQGAAQGSGVGAVAGGVVGGLLGNQVGGGSGRTLATVAGAVGGGFAGNAIEKRMKTTYQVRVRMDNGDIRNFPYNNQPNWQVGDRIRVVDGYLTARG